MQEILRDTLATEAGGRACMLHEKKILSVFLLRSLSSLSLPRSIPLSFIYPYKTTRISCYIKKQNKTKNKTKKTLYVMKSTGYCLSCFWLRLILKLCALKRATKIRRRRNISEKMKNYKYFIMKRSGDISNTKKWLVCEYSHRECEKLGTFLIFAN